MPEADGATETIGRSDAQTPPGRPQVEGIVVTVTHGFAEVAVGPSTLLCTLRGRLTRPAAPPTPPAQSARRSSPPRPGHAPGRAPGRQGKPASTAEPAAAPVRVAPGDHVRVTPLSASEGVIEALLPRRSVLARSAGEAGGAHVMLANPDHAALIFAVRDPAPHFGMLDRYLALCEHADIAVTICLNKVDLGVPADVARMAALYTDLGYQLLWTSAVTGEHLAELRERLADRISLLSGPSGVGKSSLVNTLVPGASQRTNAVSAATGKGRHTTTGARLLPLAGGGWLADSAGIRELALWNVPPEDLPRCFVELRPVAEDCLYEDCDHSAAEEGCALRAALASGRITPARFASFERLLREARGEDTDRAPA
jgi:ribosome biogenesis GTPase